jgi:hypothetical protein
MERKVVLIIFILISFKNILKKRIKVIIPEFPIKLSDGKVHNTGFHIIFKDNSSINIEVEWKTSRLIMEN